ncbi:MAG TPA: SDR family oxidoreductase, partial [Bacteroidales bacterium]|nr:SDR family oxidoreductase [Bacteroidales bacterium]
MENRNQTALITGATSGIGYELANLFARDGYSLVIIARDSVQLDKVANEFLALGAGNVTAIPKDLSKPDVPREVYEFTQNRGIIVDYLINDAGVGEVGMFFETDINKEIEIINLNIVALVYLTKLYLREMLKRGSGRIMQLASVASYQPTPRLTVYAATKAFVLSFTDSLIYELKDTGVTMTALIPGPTDTDFFRKAHAEHTKVAQSDPQDADEVAKEGYEGFFRGEHHVVSSAFARTQVAMGAMLPN